MPTGICTKCRISTTYTHLFDNGNSLTFTGNYSHESEVQAVDNIPDVFREVNLVNASITYAFENGLELGLWGRNLTEDEYILQAFPSVAQAGSISGYPNKPRTYGAVIRFKF